jgi:hypothetical protein
MEKASRDRGYFIDRSQERGFVRLRRFVKARDFSHELERSSSNLFVSDGRIEIEEGFDIPAHAVGPPFSTYTNPNLSSMRGIGNSLINTAESGPYIEGMETGGSQTLERREEYLATM